MGHGDMQGFDSSFVAFVSSAPFIKSTWQERFSNHENPAMSGGSEGFQREGFGIQAGRPASAKQISAAPIQLNVEGGALGSFGPVKRAGRRFSGCGLVPKQTWDELNVGGAL